MADVIKVFQAYSPKIKIQGMVERNQLEEYIKGRSSLTAGTIRKVLSELQEGLLFFARMGYSVRLEGVGSFSPAIDRKGAFKMNYRPDKNLLEELGHEFEAKIRNKEMLDKTQEEFIARWNREHPDDPVNI